MASTNICIFGASTTYGSKDVEGGGWVDRLKRMCFAQYEKVKVYNLGVSGNTTMDLLKRFSVEAQARKPHIIILSLGFNDSAYTQDGAQKVSLDQYTANVQQLLDQAQQNAPHIFVLGAQPINESQTQPVSWSSTHFSTERIQEYYDVLEHEAIQRNIPFIPIDTAITVENLVDGVHPGSEGHKRLAEHVFEFLREYISEV